ncbi:MAG: carboxypeptidase regulatory-like domain-containing protein [Verrucomicrobiota bacterium]|jgi:plastocyanin|nr:carboxypeptidase regulatory-like domain-containing protein [Verrucomicrobiota bacterium]
MKLWLAFLLLAIQAPSAMAAPAKGPAGDSSRNTGTIEGVVHYQTDLTRRWRYQRYYVRKSKAGELAEAVVALNVKGKKEQLAGQGRPPKLVVMDQINFRFVPETLAIRAGGSVQFKNSDDSLHNVMTYDGAKPFNINLIKGGKHVQKFDRAGGLAKPLHLSCIYHGAMQAWVYVFDHPHYQVTGADGKFRLTNVPPGEHELALRHPAGKLTWKKMITVKAGETTRIEIRVSPDNLIQPIKK